MTREEMAKKLAENDAADLVRWAIQGLYEEIVSYVQTHALAHLTNAAIHTDYIERYGDSDELGALIEPPEPSAYCDLAFDEVCAENCVTCPYWDGCEYVTATVLPNLLNGLVQYIEGDLDEASDAFGDDDATEEMRDWVDTVYAVITRLKGELNEEREDYPL